MTYRIVWRPQADTELLALWLRAADRERFATAAENLELALGHDPHLLGESRGGEGRLVFHRPFSVLFRVVPADSTVYVLRVRWAGE